MNELGGLRVRFWAKNEGEKVKLRGATLNIGRKTQVGVLEKCLEVGKFVKSLGKVMKKRAQKLVGLQKVLNFLEEKRLDPSLRWDKLGDC